jgi:hypothetical protein
MGCDTTMSLEFFRLFHFTHNSAYSESAFESKNQRLKSYVSRYTGDLGDVSNPSSTQFEGAPYENKISCH